MHESLRVLVVATKSPWPALGGGSLTLHGLLLGLVEAGVNVRVTALGPRPAGEERPPYEVITTDRTKRRWPGLRELGGARSSFSLARYRVRALRDLVAAQTVELAPHVVHLEQLHVGWLLHHFAARVPVVLREQNVEHVLFSRLAEVAPPRRRWLLRLEARLLAREEARTCARAGLVAAISEVDAAAVRALAPAARVAVLPAAWPGGRAPATLRLAGDPAFLCVGSFDWIANRDGAVWLLREVWPRIRASAPGAVLHLAGPGSESLRSADSSSVVRHGQVDDPSALFDPACVALVPVRAASGVRMRLLAAWDHGVPAVTSPIGGEGLVAEDGDGAALAATAPEFAAAALRVACDLELRRRLVAAGRAKLTLHAPARVAAAAIELYREVISRRGGPASR